MRVELEGYSLDLPAGWSDVLDDATYSDPDQAPPVTLSSARQIGAIYVSVPSIEEDESTMASLDMEALVLEWGERRGVAPLAASRSDDRDRSIATAAFRIGDEFVQLWLVSNGYVVVEVSYVCPWPSRYEEQAEREAIVASLRFS